MTEIKPTATTDEILRELGRRLQQYRLQQNRTLESVATDAGIGSATMVRAEAGERPTLATLIKILRALGRLDALDAFLPAPLVSPLQLAALRDQERQRAGTPRRRHNRSERDDG
jgi:transcriptional regulator with XRE-family HTH domain